MARIGFYLAVFVAGVSSFALAQSGAPPKQADLTAAISTTKMQTTDDWNHRLQELVKSTLSNNSKDAPSPGDYRIGPNDLLKITVLEAPDLSHPARVSADGEISMPMLGIIKAAGLTPRELELVLEALLRRTYMKDPHVAVTVTDMPSHSVSVVGAVKKPGVFQIRGTKTVLEMLSMAEGLAPDAGDAVLVMRGANADLAPYQPSNSETKSGAEAFAPGEVQARTISASSDHPENKPTVEISLKHLLDSGDPKYNVPVYPGDIVKVKAAGIVYVVGDVKQPGGFPVKDNEHITVLQAIALGQGLAPNASKNKAAIIRIAENGQQIEVPVHLNQIMSGKSPDLPLRPKDILFIPKNGAKSASKAFLTTFAQWVVWRGVP